MKRGLFVLLMLSVALGISAEGFLFRVGGGVSSHYGGSTLNVGMFQIGAAYNLGLSDNFSVEPGLFYMAKGWKNHDRVMQVYDNEGNAVFDDYGNPVEGKMNVTANTNYLELPVLFSYRIPVNDVQGIIVSAGPYVAYGVGGKTKTRGDTEQSGAARLYYSYPTFKRDGMHRFDSGITAGVSYQFNSALSVGVFGDFGLAKINEQGARNQSFFISLSYSLSQSSR